MDDRAARRWVARATGAREVREIRSLTFGIMSDVRLLEADGRPLVLRRYPLDSGSLGQTRDTVESETNAMRAARSVLGAVVAEVIASDPIGAQAGDPAILMTYLPGRAEIHGVDPGPLAETLTRLHEAPIPLDLGGFHHWFQRGGLRPPVWASAPGDWAVLAAALRRDPPGGTVAFIHRDFHPGNLLFEDGALSGVVDWTFSCAGPRQADVAHTRCNLALVDGLDAADAFLAAYELRNPGYRHHPWWDAGSLISMDDGFSGVLAFTAFGARVTLEGVRDNAERFAHSLASADW